MRVIVKSGKRKMKIDIDNALEEQIHRIARKYMLTEKKVLAYLLDYEFEKLLPQGNEEEIKKELEPLLDEMFALEGKWAAIRYRAYTYMKENKGIAITLSGFLGQNRNLKNMLHLPRNLEEIEEVVDYYLWL